MFLLEKILIIFTVSFGSPSLVNGIEKNCSFRMYYTADFSLSKQPKVLRKSSKEIISPDVGKQYIELKSGESCIFHCPGPNNNITYELINQERKNITDPKNVEVFCWDGTFFGPEGLQIDVDSIVCEDKYETDTTLVDMKKMKIWYGYNDDGDPVFQPSETFAQYDVGTLLGTEFHPQLHVWWSINNCETHSIETKMLKADDSKRNRDIINDISKSSTAFTCSESRFQINYDETSQKNSFDNSLSNVQTKFQPNTKFVLVPVYLIPPSHMNFPHGALATGTWLNIAPQWKTIRDGNWAITQNFILNYLAKNNDLHVISATLDQLKFKHPTKNDGDLIPMYLYNDGQTKEIPIPLYFVKIVYDDYSQVKGTAYVTVNNPYMNSDDDTIKYYSESVCYNPLPETRGPRWNFDTFAPSWTYNQGYSFKCVISRFLFGKSFAFNDTALINRVQYLDG